MRKLDEENPQITLLLLIKSAVSLGVWNNGKLSVWNNRTLGIWKVGKLGESTRFLVGKLGQSTLFNTQFNPVVLHCVTFIFWQDGKHERHG
jgi:hypothetical protein